MPHQLSLSLSTISVPAAAYTSLHHPVHSYISISHISLLSLSVNTTISDLTILEFILWTTNLRKQLHKNLKYDT
jgi:hypothetical protein